MRDGIAKDVRFEVRLMFLEAWWDFEEEVERHKVSTLEDLIKENTHDQLHDALDDGILSLRKRRIIPFLRRKNRGQPRWARLKLAAQLLLLGSEEDE